MGAAQGTGALNATGAAAETYARQLLAALGAAPGRSLDLVPEHPALTAAACGLMAMTGAAGNQPLLCPVPLASCADGALAALASLAPARAFEGLRGSQLLCERAAIFGHRRAGLLSAGGSCRLLEAADGWIALNLARGDDWELLPAWLEAEVAPAWDALAHPIALRSKAELVERGRLLGLAVCAEPDAVSAHAQAALVPAATAARPARARGDRPLVVDLSSLWAGPLCTHLLQRCGAEVIKVESLGRPDGARHGPPEFFDLLNAGKRSVALDFATTQGRARLRVLIAQADIVIEASRPRALRQLGIDAAALLRERPQLIWVGISGHGRGEPQEQWIAYGDDAGVAGGLTRVMYEAHGRRSFVGDAIADPLTGLHAALAAWAAWRSGTGGLLDLSLTAVVRRCLAFDAASGRDAWRERAREWQALLQAAGRRAAAPQARTPAGRAAALGADTVAVLQHLRSAC